MSEEMEMIDGVGIPRARYNELEDVCEVPHCKLAASLLDKVFDR